MTSLKSKRTTASLLVGTMLIMTACTTGQVVTTLEGVITAAEVAVPLIAPVGIPPIVVDLVGAYLQSAMIGVQNVSVILNDPTKTAGQKVAAVVASLSGLVKPNLPAGTPTHIVDAMNNVANAIEQFLGTVRPAMAAKNAKAVQKTIKVGKSDHEKLADIQVRASSTLLKIQSMPKGGIFQHPPK